MRSSTGTDNPSAVLTEDEVEQMRRERVAGRRIREIAADHGVSESCVMDICQGRTWRHLDQGLMEQAAAVRSPRGRGPAAQTPEQIRAIRARRANGDTLTAIATDCKLAVETVRRICAREHYDWVA